MNEAKEQFKKNIRKYVESSYNSDINLLLFVVAGFEIATLLSPFSRLSIIFLSTFYFMGMFIGMYSFRKQWLGKYRRMLRTTDKYWNGFPKDVWKS